MKNVEQSTTFVIQADLYLEFEDSFDDNWLVSGSDLFKGFDELA